jgi:cytochrome P450
MTPTLRLGDVPTITGSPLLGVLPRLLGDPLSLYSEATALGGIVRLRVPLGPAYFISSPELIQDVMQKRSKIFRRPPLLRRALLSLGGDNLMTRESEAWLSRRRLMQPSLQRAEVAGLAELVLDAIDSALDSWEPYLERESCLRERLISLTREVVARTLLGVSLLRSSALGSAFATLTDYIAYRATTPLAPPLWWPSQQNRDVRAALKYLNRLTDELIAERRAQASERADLLSNLLSARDTDSGRGLDDGQLRNEVQMLIGAGETTTSEALSFCFSLLGSHPEVLDALLNELDSTLAGRRVALADLKQLPLLKQVLDETLRLYPPSYALARAPMEATTLGGVQLRKWTTVVFSPYALHRDPRFWDAPAAFRPQRFQKGGESEHAPRYAYLPFGAGPRRCLAENLAQLEIALAVARILQRFTLVLPSERAPVLSAGFALRLRDGLPARIARRSSAQG